MAVTESRRTTLNSAQETFARRALDNEPLPFFRSARTEEINRRSNALSLKRIALIEETEELKGTIGNLAEYKKSLEMALDGAKQGSREYWHLKSEFDTVTANLKDADAKVKKSELELSKVKRRLGDYGEMEVKPFSWWQVFRRGSAVGATTGLAAEFSTIALLIALSLPITPVAIAVAIGAGVALGGAVGAAQASRLSESVKQAEKEMMAAQMALDAQGIKMERGTLKKAIWCLRNGVPITESNLQRGKKDMLAAMEQARKEGHEVYNVVDKKIAVLWDPKDSTCAYFTKAGHVQVVNVHNKNDDGFIAYYSDNARDILQYRAAMWPKSAMEQQTNRVKFEELLNERVMQLKDRWAELNEELRAGRMRGN